MDDKQLRKAIMDELEFDPRIDAANVAVVVDDGIVTLTGHVASYVEKVAAENAARRVKGVRAIAEELEVRYPATRRLPTTKLYRCLTCLSKNKIPRRMHFSRDMTP